MRIAIVHYHLRGGGVTRVIEMAVSGLLKSGHEVIVFSGEPAPADCRIPPDRLAVVPELSYGSDNFEGLLAGVHSACHQHWGVPADVLHLHNHALGKNSALPRAVARWSRDSRPLVLQLHDFAENRRPQNYRRLLREIPASELPHALYPNGAAVHLAVLTTGAQERFKRLGGQATILPNPISLPDISYPVSPSDLGADAFVVYPTRGIPRKNLGEFLLHSLLAPEGVLFVITSAPASGSDLDAYLRWQQFAKDCHLPVRFNAAAQRSVYEFLPNARLALTTSIEEGFGMAFLEPWAAGCGVAGRDLPDITRDFSSIEFPSLYQRISVPRHLISSSEFEAQHEASLNEQRSAYGVSSTANLTADSGYGSDFDFGSLSAGFQMELLKLVLRGKWCPPAPLSFEPMAREIVEKNKSAIEEAYSLPAYTARLERLYQKVAGGEPNPCSTVCPQEFLRSFLAA